MLDHLRAFWALNPVRCAAIIASGLVVIATQLGVVVDEASVTDSLLLIVPILLGGEAARAKVTPYQGDVGPANDELLPADPAEELPFEGEKPWPV